MRKSHFHVPVDYTRYSVTRFNKKFEIVNKRKGKSLETNQRAFKKNKTQVKSKNPLERRGRNSTKKNEAILKSRKKGQQTLPFGHLSARSKPYESYDTRGMLFGYLYTK